MAYHQNTSVDSDKLIIGNYKLEYAASVAATYVNIGAGMLTSWSHDFDKWDVQAGNAPDPIEGIATETCTFNFDMIEYDGSVMSAISCGLVTASTASSVNTLLAGGNSTLTPKVFRLTSRRLISGATVDTIITVYRGTPNSGPVIQTKSDNDSNPVNVLQWSVTGELDTSRTAGDQLYMIQHDEA